MERTVRAVVVLLLVGCGEPTASEGGGESDVSTEGSTSDAVGSSATGNPTTSGAGGEASTTPANEGTTSTGQLDETGAATSTGAELPACAGPTFRPGRRDDVELGFGGALRSYDLYVPDGLDPNTPVPLVVNLHAYLSSDDLQANFSNFDDAADRAGVVVVYPRAEFNSWNAGACCGQAQIAGNDDVGFVRAVVADVQAQGCVDDRRIYATGMSNGGFMTHRLACEAADLFAAVAPVAGVIGVEADDCAPSRPIPVMHFHGTADFVVSYFGGLFESVEGTIDGWRARNGCEGEPERVIDVGEAWCDAYSACDDGSQVVLCTVDGGGHCWPGNAACLGAFSTTMLNANEVMLDFFSGFSLP